MKGQLNLGGENSRLPVPGEWGGREWRVGGGKGKLVAVYTQVYEVLMCTFTCLLCWVGR